MCPSSKPQIVRSWECLLIQVLAGPPSAAAGAALLRARSLGRGLGRGPPRVSSAGEAATGDLLHLDPNEPRLGAALPREQRQVHGVDDVVELAHLVRTSLEDHAPRLAVSRLVAVHLIRDALPHSSEQLGAPVGAEDEAPTVDDVV